MQASSFYEYQHLADRDLSLKETPLEQHVFGSLTNPSPPCQTNMLLILCVICFNNCLNYISIESESLVCIAPMCRVKRQVSDNADVRHGMATLIFQRCPELQQNFMYQNAIPLAACPLQGHVRRLSAIFLYPQQSSSHLPSSHAGASICSSRAA